MSEQKLAFVRPLIPGEILDRALTLIASRPFSIVALMTIAFVPDAIPHFYSTHGCDKASTFRKISQQLLIPTLSSRRSSYGCGVSARSLSKASAVAIDFSSHFIRRTPGG